MDEGGAAVADSASGDTGLMDLPRQLPKQSWEVSAAADAGLRASDRRVLWLSVGDGP